MDSTSDKRPSVSHNTKRGGYRRLRLDQWVEPIRFPSCPSHPSRELAVAVEISACQSCLSFNRVRIRANVLCAPPVVHFVFEALQAFEFFALALFIFVSPPGFFFPSTPLRFVPFRGHLAPECLLFEDDHELIECVFNSAVRFIGDTWLNG